MTGCQEKSRQWLTMAFSHMLVLLSLSEGLFFKGCLSLRFLKPRFKVTWIGSSRSRWRGWICTAGSPACSRTAQIWALDLLVCCTAFPANSEQRRAELQHPYTLFFCSWCKRDSWCWSNWRTNAITLENLVGTQTASLGSAMGSGLIRWQPVTEFQRGTAGYSSTAPNWCGYWNNINT